MILKDARRPCYAVVFDATDSEVLQWKIRGVDLLRVRGVTTEEKTLSLWQFLDILQTKHYVPHAAWLAPDSVDFTSSMSISMRGNIDALQTTLANFAQAILEQQGPLDETEIDFMFPFLILGANYGLSIHSDVWYECHPRTLVNLRFRHHSLGKS